MREDLEQNHGIRLSAGKSPLFNLKSQGVESRLDNTAQCDTMVKVRCAACHLHTLTLLLHH